MALDSLGKSDDLADELGLVDGVDALKVQDLIIGFHKRRGVDVSASVLRLLNCRGPIDRQTHPD